MSAEDFRKVIDIDLNGPFIMSKAVIPSMIKKRVTVKLSTFAR